MRAWTTLILSALLLACAVPGAAQVSNPAQQMADPADRTPQDSAAGHGSISIAYLNTYVNGFWADSNTKLPNGAVRSQGVALQAEYYVSNDWSVNVGIPFFRNKYLGNQPHCPTTVPPQCAPGNPGGVPALNPPHPESNFIDDGQYHGTWQDYSFGASYHTQIEDYYLTPSVTAVIPSHEYVFFDNAAVGQRLRQLMLAVELDHQFQFTNIYYKLGYGFAFSQEVLSENTGYQRFYGELGYFFNEKLTLRTFLSGRLGNGLAADELVPLTGPDPPHFMTNAYWYHHDQISEHSYFGAGLGFDYDLGHHNTLTAGIQSEFWGETVFDFKYALEMRLTHSF
jgi:hypothetical protein